ncbi:ribosome biogenesis regulatory protein homolog [Tribolium castaneum]|uniref:Ribosome biogenesis regulatory protein n=1 Tax=Tribolium castaneum TaxID=7070 RepID=D6WYE6_TRICA|nr:PREDICTED: ribosome biogenesis regulatory protein homolog [Tribolium castaneum]EFA09302.2 Ribosome biogenesis regulatory protein homolog-like Protein [Tribolium castaneum]|eukprot:XP_008197251.1 PREDICTED: ribosome biogenesis regulatory protein homolog [Tribolium castaneum]
MDVVKTILEKSAKEAEKYKSVEVNKLVSIDLGALLAEDLNPLDPGALRSSTNDYLLNLTRDNTQLLFNQIWELPTERIDEAIVAKLPKQKFCLPRFKPVPRPRPLTKWEQFAKAKGIVKKKKSKLSWDEQLQKWIPLYGFKRSAALKEKDWLIEVPQNADPLEDQFAKKVEAKSEKVAKNELQRLRNVAKAKNVKVPRFGLTNPEVSSAKDLQAAVTVAKSSTASLGKFQDKLPKEKEARGVAAITPGATRKRKLPPISGQNEKNQNLNLVDEVLNKRPKINIEKAVARQINDEQAQRSDEKNRTGRKKGLRKSGGGKKPKNTNRPRKGKAAGGRKRR